MTPQEPKLGTHSTSDAEIRIVDPHAVLEPVSDDECWSRMSEADIVIIGMRREEYEKTFEGNPCSNSWSATRGGSS